jgi:hypothetical protein
MNLFGDDSKTLSLSPSRNGDSRSAKLSENAITQIPSAARVILFIRPLNKRKPFQPSTVGGKNYNKRGRGRLSFFAAIPAQSTVFYLNLSLGANDFCSGSDGTLLILKNTTFVKSPMLMNESSIFKWVLFQGKNLFIWLLVSQAL